MPLGMYLRPLRSYVVERSLHLASPRAVGLLHRPPQTIVRLRRTSDLDALRADGGRVDLTGFGVVASDLSVSLARHSEVDMLRPTEPGRGVGREHDLGWRVHHRQTISELRVLENEPLLIHAQERR